MGVLLAVLLNVISPATARADDDDLAFTPAWLSVGGGLRTNGTSSDDAVVFAELGIAWDAGAPRRSQALHMAGLSESSPTPNALAASVIALPISPRVARSAVHAAYRAARFITDDALEGLATRARWSGLVPEVRVGARRAWDDSARFDVTTSDDWRAAGGTMHANLWLEARAAFRLDRLLFADEELAVARLRLAQSEAAQRLALRVVSGLGAWQRAWIENKAAPHGTVAALEASVKLNELEATLDVLTGGWFASWRAREAR